mmetsp:Transcript_3058/g.5241  ORF Transcript_3058/g.5241 Transcript_3058/m.5241 type:complete len:119 (+) Transcript_3058:314-670(+)
MSKIATNSEPYAPKRSTNVLLAILLSLLHNSEVKREDACTSEVLEKIEQLRYSKVDDAVFCLPCVATSSVRLQQMGYSNVQFVTQGFRNWPDIRRRFNSQLEATQKKTLTCIHTMCKP